MALASDSSSKTFSGGSTVSSNFSKWADSVPRVVTPEDAMSASQVVEVWNKMFSFAKMKSPNESEQIAFKAGVYTYACLNGTSREGNYSSDIQLANGTVINASIIPRATGKYAVRKFFRGCMNESYEFLKTSHVMESHERFIAKCAQLQVGASVAFATADWLDDCPLFTPEEVKAHDASFTHGLSRAKRARSGHTLESVEQHRTDRMLESNGTLEPEAGSLIKF